jgi:hypothetical protein
LLAPSGVSTLSAIEKPQKNRGIPSRTKLSSINPRLRSSFIKSPRRVAFMTIVETAHNLESKFDIAIYIEF